jgi:hypothetical protein
MGHLDQFAKLTFAEETGPLTGGALAWEVPAEMRISEVRPDGLLLVRDPDKLVNLAPPWNQARGHAEILAELKMQGDHTDPRAMQRGLLRRQVRQVQRIEAIKIPAAPWLGEEPIWMVAPSLPEVLSRIRQVSVFAPGCYRVGPSAFDFVWIAANELPLLDELIPFLIARSGRPLDEFVRWVAPRRPLDWMLRVLHFLPVSNSLRDEILRYLPPPPTDDPVLLDQRRHIARALVDSDPEVRKGYVEEGKMQMLVHQFERRLGRTLSAEEHRTLAARLGQLGPDRLGDVVVDLPSETLAAWLATPDAT